MVDVTDFDVQHHQNRQSIKSIKARGFTEKEVADYVDAGHTYRSRSIL